MAALVKYKHYGPWDLKGSLDEQLPDKKKEIGKKKLKIPPNVLHQLDMKMHEIMEQKLRKIVREEISKLRERKNDR